MTATATRPRRTSTKKGGRKYPAKTPEQREAESKARQDMLMGEVAKLTTAEGWTNYLKMSARFHNYSFGNMMLIFAQKPDATRVASFTAWEAMGRKPHPKTGLRISAPRSRWPRQDEIDKGKDPDKKITYFVAATVFDISDTYVKDEEKWAKVAGTPPVMENLQGEDEEGMGDRIAEFLVAYGWEVVEEDLKGGLEGYADPRKKRVSFRTGTAPAERASTLAHEAAHVVDGHTDDLAEYSLHRGKYEAIAESVAYVLADAFGIDTGPYSVGYVAHWTEGDLELLKQVGDAVQRTVKKILTAITHEEDADDDTEE
jgi:hypothetical protein